MLLPAPHPRAHRAMRWVIYTDFFCARARVHPVFNSTPLMGRWDSGRLVDVDRVDNPEPSRADRERLLWSQNGIGLIIEYASRLLIEIKMLCQCIFNDGGTFVEKYTYVHMFGQLVNSLISGLVMLFSVGVVLFHKSRW